MFLKSQPYPSYEDLISEIAKEGVLQDHRLRKAFEEVDRKSFVPDAENAYLDMALPIGCNQTISQPYTVAFMLDKLGVQQGDKVLEIGFGSGWQTVILSNLVGHKGEVHATELISDLYKWGKQNIAKYHPSNVYTYLAHETELGIPACAPFDKIITGAAARDQVPAGLIDQLAVGGTLVIPVGNAIYKVHKAKTDDILEERYVGFSFVPLIYSEEN